ncbi:MAG TPA: hypothetical protein VMG30_17970 [Acidobacteriota bacterium]|nr:hypothetical protein [Acidobacteriota bacterium]
MLEPCRSFSFKFKIGRPYVQSARRKCLFLYFYFMDRDLGLIHGKLQTWFPMPIQVYVNAHEWLARKLAANKISLIKHDNVFVHMEDWERAQKFADRFAGRNWPRILERYAHLVNPLRKDLFHGRQHYWVTAQSAKVSRILSRFHAHKLIAKIPRTRKWRVTDRGRRVMATALRLRHTAFPELYQKALAA